MPHSTPEKRQAYRIKHRSEHAAQERKRRALYGDIIYARHRERYATDPEYRKKQKQYNRDYHAKKLAKLPSKPKRTPAQRQEHRRLMHQRVGKAWYQRNKERRKTASHAWYEAHKDSVKQHFQLWKIQHPKQFAESQRLCRQRRRTALVQSGAGISREQWEAIKKTYKNRCAYCGSKRPLGMDHVIPLSKGGTHTPDNIVPACRSCNCRKHANSPPMIPPLRLLL